MARSARFNHEDLTVCFGGELSKPQSIFKATALKIPTYSYTKREKEALKGGWYSDTKVINTYTESNHYIIIKDGECIGQMKPYSQKNIKSDLNPCNKYAREFVESKGLNINTQYLL